MANHVAAEHLAPVYGLPNELLWQIMQYLPLYEAVKLAISSRRLYERADPKVWAQVRCTQIDDVKGRVAASNDEERWTFLNNMEMGLPTHELCHYCRVLHPCGTSQQQSLWRPPSKHQSEIECDAKEVQFRRWGVDWGFGFRDVYAIVSHRRLGDRHGRPLSDFCISTDWTFAQAYKNVYNASRSPFKRFLSYTKLDTEASFQGDVIVVHRVQRLWVPIHLQGTDVLVRYGVGNIAGDFKICSHHNPQSGEMIYNFVLPLRNGLKCVLAARSALDSIDVDDMPLPRIIKRCEDCPTEYCITFHVHPGGSVEIVVNVWQNLGRGQAPQSTGWLNCWGSLNPRFSGSPQEDAWRTEWIGSDVAYVGDETLFPTGAGQSAAEHPSAAAVLRHWDELHSRTKETGTGAGPLCSVKKTLLDVVPQMSKHHFKQLRNSYVRARFDGGPRRQLPTFPFSFKSRSGLARTYCISYTRSAWNPGPRVLPQRRAPT
ncbi:hypothetical protein BX600DRAFT_550934 [Xylariales sp. PMI_506]|nr:hypothetical protein BX600DRAFT_550934 [Xylariales sp. PMI_506]